MNNLALVYKENELVTRLRDRAARIPTSYFSGHEAQFVLRVGSDPVGLMIAPDALQVSSAVPSNPAFVATISVPDFQDLEAAQSDVMTLLNTGRITVSDQVDGTDALKSLQYAVTLLLSRWYLTEDCISTIETARLGYDIGTLDRIDATDHAGFNAYGAAGTPVLIAGVADAWPMRQVGFDALLTKVRDIPVSLLRREHGPDSPATYEASTLHDYVQTIRNLQNGDTNCPYLAANAIPRELEDMVGLPTQFEPDAFANTRMWIGPKGTGLNYHRDMVDNFIVQAFGQKKLSLIAPHHAADMRPERLGGNPFYHPSARTLLDEAAAVSALQPATLDAQITVTLDEGDAIYLPAGWWHQVRNVTLSWSFNFFAVNQPPLVLSHTSGGRT
jgi:hypothetical protein